MRNHHFYFIFILIISGCINDPEDCTTDGLFPVPVCIDNNSYVIFVHPTDNATNIIWGSEEVPTGALDAIDGQANTQLIITILTDAAFSEPYAAKICDELVAFGCDDWYLPSQIELNAMHKYLRENEDAFTSAPGSYWSSTENQAITSSAYTQNFNNAVSLGDNHPKEQALDNCRCVRKADNF